MNLKEAWLWIADLFETRAFVLDYTPEVVVRWDKGYKHGICDVISGLRETFQINDCVTHEMRGVMESYRHAHGLRYWDHFWPHTWDGRDQRVKFCKEQANAASESVDRSVGEERLLGGV